MKAWWWVCPKCKHMLATFSVNHFWPTCETTDCPRRGKHMVSMNWPPLPGGEDW